MNQDIRFKTDYFHYHMRVVGLINNKDKDLIQKVDDAPYYVLPGGHMEFGEDSNTSLKREIFEEVGCNIKQSNLFCIHENFYTKNNFIEHWTELYFKIIQKEQLPDDNWEVVENDKGLDKLLKYRWVTKEELKLIDLRPSNIKELIVNNSLDSINHMVSKDI